MGMQGKKITKFTAYFSLTERRRSLIWDGECWSVYYVMDTSTENCVGVSFKSSYFKKMCSRINPSETREHWQKRWTLCLSTTSYPVTN